MSFRTLLAIPFVLVVFSASPAGAEQSAAHAAAEELFRAGRAAADAGDQRTACQKFAESDRLESAVGTWLNLGICFQALGDLVSAKREYTRVIAKLDASDSRFVIATQHVNEVEQKLAYVTLQAEGASPSNLTVSEAEGDGTNTVLAVGPELAMNPGSHELVVTATGHKERRYPFELREGEHKELTLESGPAFHPASPASTPRPETAKQEEQTPAKPHWATPAHSSPKRTWAYVAGGTGIGLLAVSGVTAYLVEKRKQTVEDDCPGQLCNSDRGMDASKEGKLFAALSTVTFIAGVGALGAGIYLFVTSSNEGSSRTKAVRILPTLSVRSASIDAEIKF